MLEELLKKNVLFVLFKVISLKFLKPPFLDFDFYQHILFIHFNNRRLKWKIQTVLNEWLQFMLLTSDESDIANPIIVLWMRSHRKRIMKMSTNDLKILFVYFWSFLIIGVVYAEVRFINMLKFLWYTQYFDSLFV